MVTVLVLMGGIGREREVSLLSGREVVKALKAAGHKVLESDISPDDLTALDIEGFDVVFPALHGIFGEGGWLQEILEKRNLRFTGSDSKSSRLAMDKFRAKAAFERAGLLTPEAQYLSATACGSELPERIDRALERIQWPCVVKPNAEGSSIGITIAQTQSEAHDSAKAVIEEYGDCLIEQYIVGREITVSILQGQAMPLVEVKTSHLFYDYEAKYLDDSTQYLFEIGLDPSVLSAISDQALRAFEVLGCRDFGRVDFMVDRQNRAFLLEVNTIPGLTSHSLLPKSAAHLDNDMAQLCDRIIQIALNRPILEIWQNDPPGIEKHSLDGSVPLYRVL